MASTNVDLAQIAKKEFVAHYMLSTQASVNRKRYPPTFDGLGNDSVQHRA